MKFSDLLLMSISNLWKRKLRTVLTVLGVMIGITSIVVMISLGNGLKESIMDQMSNYANIMQITIYSNNNYYGSSGGQSHFLNDSLVEELSHMDHVEAVYPQLSINSEVKTGKYRGNFTIIGMTEEGLKNNLDLGEGSFPTENYGTLELFFGNTTKTDFYNEKTKKNEYYETGTLPDIDFLNDKFYLLLDTSSNMNDDNSGSNQTPKQTKVKASCTGVMEGTVEDWKNGCYNVYAELNSLKKVLEKNYKNKVIPNQPTKKNGKPYKEIFYSEIIVQVDDLDYVVPLTQSLTEMGYSAYNDAEWIQQQTDQLNMIQGMLGLIGAVSLIVAAIGITNTMMMSIYERTKEIGVMKVLGCDIRNIQALFLFEAGFIGLIGGVCGVGLSAGLCSLIPNILKSTGMMEQLGYGSGSLFAMPIWLPGMAIIFAVIIGMISGFFPSLRAMRLSPLAAIRNE